MIIQNERIDYIDIFKGIGIILMIMGHIGFGEHFDVFIHAFHMPMFFFVSGFLYNNKQITFNSFVCKKAKALLVPYLFFGLLHLGYVFVVYKNIQLSYLYHLFFVNTDGLPIAGALWFLTALFFTNTLYYLIRRFIKNRIMVNAVVVVLALFGNTCNLLFPFELPFALSAAFVGVGLFHVGTLFKRFELKIVIHRLLNLDVFSTLGLACVTIVLIFVNGAVNMRTGSYSIIPLFWINAILAIILFFNISKIVNNAFRDSIIHKWIVGIGKNSIVYVCLNQIVLVYIGYYSGGGIICEAFDSSGIIILPIYYRRSIGKNKIQYFYREKTGRKII